MNKPRSHKRLTLLAVALLIGLPCVVCVMWVRKEQRQYALNRQLIAALKRNDGKQALTLVNAGADPNTRCIPTPAPSWSKLINQWLRHAPSMSNESSTAFIVACGGYVRIEKGNFTLIQLENNELAPLVQTMLVHGANPNAKRRGGWTPLLNLISSNPRKEVVQLLLTYGADPDCADIMRRTPITLAQEHNRPDLVALLRQYSKHP